MYDAVIIGGGAVGCAVARELSRWKLKICLAEQGEDVCVGTSKANSAIVHAGFDAPTGSMKARFNVEGSRRMEALSRELDFPYRRNGALVVCFEEAGLPRLEEPKAIKFCYNKAKYSMMIKCLLKRHRYPPEGMDDAVQTVMTQCELWTENNDMESA